MWGCSSAGRALPSQGRGREFKSLHLHHHDDQRSDNVRPLFLFSLFVLYFPLPPWGTISPRSIHKLHLAAVSPLPEETVLPLCGRPSTKEAPERMSGERLKFTSSSALLLPTPAPHALSMAEAIRSHRALRPCIKSAGRAFPLPPAPDAVISAVTSRQTAFSPIFPTCPRQRRACHTAPRLPITPVRNIPVS